MTSRATGAPVALADLVWQRLEARIEETLAAIETVVAVLLERPATAAELRQAREAAQVLAGGLGRVGLTAAAEIARTLDDCFQEEEAAASAVQAAEVLDDVRAATRGAAADVLVARHAGPSVLFVGPVAPEGDELMWVALGQSFAIAHTEGQELPFVAPDAVVVYALDASSARYRLLLRAIREQYAKAPLVVVSGGPRTTVRRDRRGRFRRGDANVADSRLAIARHADAIVEIGSAPSVALDEVRAGLARRRATGEVVLVGGRQDALVVELAVAGIATRTLADVGEGYAALSGAQSATTAVVIDDDTRQLTRARSLGRLLRADPSLRGTPLLALAPAVTPQLTLRALHDGVDDVLPREASADELVARIRRALRRRVDLAPAAALASDAPLPWSTATLALSRLLVHALRRRLRVALAVVEADPSAMSATDAETLADVLHDEFRAEDIVARFDEARVVVGLPGAGARVAVRRLDAILSRLDLPEGACRAGVAEFPADGRAIDELVAAGLSVLDRSRAAGGPHVVSAEWRPENERGPDVVVIDGDPVFGPVLADLIARSGRRAAWIDAGDAALEELAAGGIGRLPRTLLLEFDLPGLDGLEVLGRLSALGLLSHLDVLMLTARTRDADLRRAFALGALDVIPKPVSPVVLLHRLARVADR